MFFSESIRILAGIQTLPDSLASTSRCTFMTVSRSVATTVSLFFSTSNKKSSRIGNTVLALITPLICCNCFNNADEETMNFMFFSVSGETTDFCEKPNSYVLVGANVNFFVINEWISANVNPSTTSIAQDGLQDDWCG